MRFIFSLGVGILMLIHQASGSPVLFGNNGNYYEFVNASFNWDDANRAAQEQVFMGVAGHLATITSAAEQTFVYDQVYKPNVPVTSNAYSAWLGGFQSIDSIEPGGGWRWETAELWSYEYWGAGEPNDGVSNGLGPEDKLTMWGTGFWNDFVGTSFGAPNVGPLGYIVEFEVVPEPSEVTLLSLGALAANCLRRRRS